MKHEDALAQLARETARARWRLGAERAVRAAFWPLFATGAWAAVALTGAHAVLPSLAQSLTALAALLGLVMFAWRRARGWRAPNETEARARLAADSHLEASAFEALRDRPTRHDPLSYSLWRKEQDQAVARAERARAKPLRWRLDDIDPRKLRYVLLAALVVAFIVARGDASDRLARAFLPDPGPLVGDQPMAVEAWLTPADYTHAAPISLSDAIGQRVTMPPAAEATVRVTGPVGAPRLVFEGRSVRFARAADGAWEARMDVAGAGRLRVVRFHTRASWRLAPAADAAPAASFAAPIANLPRERASVSWRASDDFGVRRVVLRVRPLNPPAGLTRADPVDVDLETPAGDPRAAEAETELDLANHPYAGMEVEARVVAIDATGQEGASDPLHFTLQEKVFLQPLARAAIEIRRHILAERRPYRGEARRRARTVRDSESASSRERLSIRDYDARPALARAPEGIRRAARLIDALTTEPRDGYFRDLAVYLGFRLARSELDVAQNSEATDIAADTLWRTALRAEYGGAADARRALEEAQRQLAEALQSGEPRERLQQLFEALRRATETYMQALVQDALRNGENENLEDTQEQTEISGRDIEDLLRQAQSLSEQGRTEEARQLLDMLAGILQNLDVQISESQDGQGEGSQQEQMQQSMDQLSQSLGEQRALNNETQQQREQNQGQGGGGSQQGGQGGGELADRQSQIRQGLAEAQRMAEESGVTPSQDLNAAGEAMQRAENALRQGDFESAEAAQSAALDRLRQGAEALSAEMRERGREGQEGQGGENQSSRDPLGRAAAGGNGGSETQIPTQANPDRTREILDEILERAQDPNRPEAEREYLRRLLDRWGDS